MKKNVAVRITLAISGLALLVGTRADAILIDDFDFDQSVFVTPGGANPKTSDGSAAGGALGGERDIEVVRQSGSGSMSADANLSLPGAYAHAQGPSTGGLSILTWDGIDGSSAVDPTGLGSLDLTAGGGDRFQVELRNSDHQSRLRFDVFSGAGNQSFLETPDLAPSGPQILEFLFSDFVVASGAGANFASIGAIRLTIDGSKAASSDLDLSLNFVQTNGTPVPEPSSITLLGVGLAGVGARLRKRRQSAPAS